MTKFKRGCQAQSRSYKRGGAKGYGAKRGRAHGALESGRRADGDRRGGGTGRVEPWNQEGGLTGIGEVGGQAGVIGGYSGPREPGIPSTAGKNNQQFRAA